MIQKFLEHDQKAQKLLLEIPHCSKQSECKKAFCLLQKAIYHKLFLPENFEPAEPDTNLNDLIILSIRLNDPSNTYKNDEQIISQLYKKDCHRTSLLVHKRVLLLLYIEKQLKIRMTDEEAVSIKTLGDLMYQINRHLEGGAI